MKSFDSISLPYLYVLKESLDTTVKLLPYDLEVMDLSHRNNLLQNKVRLHTINASLGLRIGRSFVHRATLYPYVSYRRHFTRSQEIAKKLSKPFGVLEFGLLPHGDILFARSRMQLTPSTVSPLPCINLSEPSYLHPDVSL